MKKLLLLSVLASTVFASCEYKITKLERELEFAREYGNIYKIRHLERALARVQAKCDAMMADDVSFQSSTSNRFNRKKHQEYYKIKDDYEEKKDAIEDALDELDDAKDSMDKATYKAKKRELKAKKRELKREYRAKIRYYHQGY